VALLKKWFAKKETAAVEPPAQADTLPEPEQDPEAAALANGEGSTIIGPDGLPKSKKGLLKRFESNIRRKVDGYVDNKAVELLDDATRRAEEFRQETLDAVRSHAMELLDATEQRIDEKLVEIEHMLETRLQAELKMRLRAMFWTLAFVLIMALVSLGYVWFKQRSGL
jgi:vacuolar-type H+-ATPase subunit H